jgi:spermidine synthase
MHKPHPLFLVSLALISAATLGYEVLLMRLFSIIQWHHFAAMIISLALLGFGASGTFLSLLGDRLQGRFAEVYLLNAGLFGVTSVGAFLIAQRIPFNPLEILWDPSQWWRLSAIYCLLLVPFLFAANCVCLAFGEYKERLNWVYAMNLLGAGLGSLGIIGILFLLFPLDALEIIGSLALLATAVGWLGLVERTRWPAALFALLALALPFGPLGGWIQLRPVEYKGLPQALHVMGARVAGERSSPLGLLTVVESPKVPFRHAPGLSLSTKIEPPEQIAIFTDGDGMGVVTRDTGDRKKLAYLDDLPSALPYYLLERPKVLVLGAGGGADVLQALVHDARQIDAVELNPQVVDLVRKDYADFTGHLYDRAEVRVHVAEARGFAAATEGRFDLIQVALLDAFNTAAAGLHAQSESYLYTVEAIQDYFRHLAPGGFLAITRWVTLPPRDGLKLFATVVEALERVGVSDPGQRLAWIRGWKTHTLLIKNGTLNPAELEKVREFSRSRWFDLAYLPGMEPSEANRYNLLSEPYFYDGARAILGPEREEFIGRYKFNIAPATDDRPYFFQFFKWPLLPELLSLRGSGGLSFLDMGYLVLVATFVQAAVLSLILILLPLCFGGSRQHVQTVGRGLRWRTVVYFFSIGLGFMFIEMAFIQKFILYLAHPLYAAAVVLAGFLLFAGLGSGTARTSDGASGARVAVAGIGLVALLYIFILPWVFGASLAQADGVKILISLGLILPLAFCMGRPFPLGLSGLADQSPGLIPWAWGINGCASVLGALLATLSAIHLGITAVILLAVGLYVLAALTYPS